MANVRALNDGLKEIARKELNEVESHLESELAEFKSWIEKQPHLNPRMDDQYLLAFLRGSKHSMEKAKSKIDHFYTIKMMSPELYAKKSMNEKFQEFIRQGTSVWISKPADSDWPNVTIVRFQNFDSKMFTLQDIFRYRFYQLEHYLKDDDNCVVGGYIDVIDLAKVPLTLLPQVNLTIVRRLAVFSEKALPIRIKGFHVLNLRKEFTDIFNIAKSYLLEKYQSRLYVHKSLEDLYKHVPREYLPKEYGGTNGNLDEMIQENFKEMMALNDFLIEDDNFGVNEKLRPKSQAISFESLFGLEGSFKKLEID